MNCQYQKGIFLNYILSNFITYYTTRVHSRILKEGGLNFSKSNQFPIVVNLVIVKQGFAVIDASLQHLFIKIPAITILKLVG